MFQFKKTGLGIKEPDNSNALPNSYGKVRTLKEDLANFEKGGLIENSNEIENPVPQETEKEPVNEAIPQIQEFPQAISSVPEKESMPNPFQSVPAPPPIPSVEPGVPTFQSNPSESFFAQKPIPEQNILSEQKENNHPLPQKAKSKFVLPLIIVILVAITGGGFYYYWFYIKNGSSAVSTTPTVPIPPVSPETIPTASPDSQNKNLRNLTIDVSTSTDPDIVKNAVQKFAVDFANTASENDLVEVKIIDKDGQPWKKTFFPSFGINIPDAIMSKLSNDFSIFARKENGSAKLGIAFRTITSSGLAEEMGSWEPLMPSNLASLYIDQVPVVATPSFNSGQYKNADIRYFNFSSAANTSLDYSIISNFLIIGTSKDMERSILDYMSEK